MHSKSGNLGYLKDQKSDIFQGLHLLDSLVPLRGLRAPPPPSPSSKVLALALLAELATVAVTYLLFHDSHFASGGMSVHALGSCHNLFHQDYF